MCYKSPRNRKYFSSIFLESHSDQTTHDEIRGLVEDFLIDNIIAGTIVKLLETARNNCMNS
ncbi:hypothetical protein HanLR1_Chr08g0290141 [Helianthus annuus]|nr:hypothetical protein HanLR1_Chr08g0290141 [Helianthus annuus]